LAAGTVPLFRLYCRKQRNVSGTNTLVCSVSECVEFNVPLTHSLIGHFGTNVYCLGVHAMKCSEVYLEDAFA